MVLNAKLRNRRLATPCTNYGTVRENMESGVLFVGYLLSAFLQVFCCKYIPEIEFIQCTIFSFLSNKISRQDYPSG